MPQTQSKLSVVLIDDHELVRTAIRAVLEDAGIEVVGEASEGEEGVSIAADKGPDIVLIDLSMPGPTGIETTRELARVAPGSRVLVLTGSAEEHDVREAITAGACGYLLKDANPDEIVAAVRAAAAGETNISPRVTEP